MKKPLVRLDMFARMLASEGISVTYSDTVETATFNVKTRVLTCPMWQGITNNIHILFIAHEVSHARHTPSTIVEDVKKAVGEKDFIFTILNIVEDVRIENLSCLDYPKIAPFYLKGYKDLVDKGFWKIPEGIEEAGAINKFDFANRINAQAKLRNLVKIPFTKEEQDIYDFLQNMRTPEDTIEGYKKVIEQMKKDPDFQNKLDEIEKMREAMSGMMSSLQDFMEKEGEILSGGEGVPGSTGDVVSDMMKEIASGKPGKDSGNSMCGRINDRVKVKDADVTPRDPTRSNEDRKTVNRLVTEFQRRKSAIINARTQVRQSGEIAPALLHTYKYNDEIFKVVGKTPNQKNHAIFFMADISGSMSSVVGAVMRRVALLTDFADVMKIPYKVMAFTDDYSNGAVLYNVYDYSMTKARRNGVINALTKGKFPLVMGGTPLVSATYQFAKEVLAFKESKGVDMITAITLTDGGEHAQEISNLYKDGIFVSASTAVHPMEIINKYLRDKGVNTIHHHIGSGYVFHNSLISWGHKESGMTFSKPDECFSLRIVENPGNVSRDEKIYARMIAQTINERI